MKRDFAATTHSFEQLKSQHDLEVKELFENEATLSFV